MKVLSFGEVLWDVYPNSEHLGGAPLNFSAHFKKCGGNSWIITAVGDDVLGRKTVSEIKNLGVNTEYITIAEQETGKCIVTLDEKQIPTYNLLNDVAYDYIQFPDTKNESFDVLYFGTLALRNENNKNVLNKILCENNFKEVFVDINIRPPYFSDEVIRYALKNATIIKISDEELPTIIKALKRNESSAVECGQILGEEFSNLKMVIITKGAEGSLAYECKSKSFFECEAQKVNVASTVGAGDSFSASFLAKYTETNDIEKALAFATKVSGYVVSCMDAIPEYDMKIFE